MKEKYILIYFGRPFAIFDSEADAQEMLLALWEERRYEKFVHEINHRNTFEQYKKYHGKCKSKKRYEKNIKEFAWNCVKAIDKDIALLWEINKIKNF